MNNIEALQGFQAQPDQTDQKAGKAGKELGKEEFLNLLVTQLKNQDPLNPSDPTEFTAQLAQYSSLEQLYNLNESMAAFEAVQGESERLSALSLIGKNVVAASDTFAFAGEAVELGYRFNEEMARARVLVKNEAGQVVDELPINAPDPGEHFMPWTGTDGEGGQLPPGRYRIEVIGTMEDGTEVRGETLVGSRVTGVDFLDSKNTLLTDNGDIQLSDVTRVNNPTQAAESRRE